jgi:hypothetical protein
VADELKSRRIASCWHTKLPSSNKISPDSSEKRRAFGHLRPPQLAASFIIVTHLRGWMDRDFYSLREVSRDNREICTTPAGRSHPGSDERSHDDACGRDAPLSRWRKHIGRSTGLRPIQNASSLLQSTNARLLSRDAGRAATTSTPDFAGRGGTVPSALLEEEDARTGTVPGAAGGLRNCPPSPMCVWTVIAPSRSRFTISHIVGITLWPSRMPRLS